MEIYLQIAVGGLLLGALYALMACGLNLIFGVMRVINVAHGEFLMLGAFSAFFFFSLLDLNPILSLFIVVPFAFLLGYTLQRMLVERLVGGPELSSLLATYGLSILIMNLGLALFTSNFRSVPVFQGSFLIGDIAFSKPRLIAAGVSIFITFSVYLFLEKTKRGKAIRAVSQHPQIAEICGIDVTKIRMLTFGIALAMAASAGVLISMIFSFSPEVGADFILKSFAIIIIGGMGSFIGAFLGGLILGLGESFTAFFLSGQWAQGVAYLLLVLVLLMKPSGLKGR
ncbi:MAG: branched-chain amino acid ABC transporter permease [Thermodesulfobacteriota bacterium]